VRLAVKSGVSAETFRPAEKTVVAVGDEWTASVVQRGWGAYNYFGAGVIVFRLLVNDGVQFFGRFKHANKMRLVAAALSIVMHVVAPANLLSCRRWRHWSQSQ